MYLVKVYQACEVSNSNSVLVNDNKLLYSWPVRTRSHSSKYGTLSLLEGGRNDVYSRHI